MQSSIALLQLSREKNLFLTLQTLKAICTLPKYIVSRFPLDCVGMLQIKDEYLEAGCNFITPEKFLSLDHLNTSENVTITSNPSVVKQPYIYTYFLHFCIQSNTFRPKTLLIFFYR